jgi:hypothetical protein
MRIEAQDTASTPAATVEENLRATGWMAPGEANEMRSRMVKLERALAGACIRFEEWREATQCARQCIEADDIIGAHQILVRALGEKE